MSQVGQLLLYARVSTNNKMLPFSSQVAAMITKALSSPPPTAGAALPAALLSPVFYAKVMLVTGADESCYQGPPGGDADPSPLETVSANAHLSGSCFSGMQVSFG